MWKFKVSKFKNASAQCPKKEKWISNITVGNMMQSSCQNVKASCQFMAFTYDKTGGGNIGILPLNSDGYRDTQPLLIQAHSDYITDFDFSPFYDHILASGSQDASLSVWDVNSQSMNGVISNPTTKFSNENHRIETVLWNPLTANILAASSNETVKVYDVTAESAALEMNVLEHQVQSLCWNSQGAFIAISSKDKQIRIIDPRCNSTVQEGFNHDNIKESKVCWLWDKDYILSSGFDKSRNREIIIRDMRRFSNPLKRISFDSSTGVLIPLYDEDTGMLFLAGKGDTVIRNLEITSGEPFMTEGSIFSTEQIKGIAKVPKRAVDVMKCEVNRLLVMGKNVIIPLPYIVPRKVHEDFCSDLFPPTKSACPALSSKQWLDGVNSEMELMSLDPSQSADQSEKTVGTKMNAPSNLVINSHGVDSVHKEDSEIKLPSTPKNMKHEGIIEMMSGLSEPISPIVTPERTSKLFTGIHQSKYRYLKGDTLQQKFHITNLRSINKSISGESDLFHVNSDRCAVPIDGAGGLISIYELNSPRRLPDVGNPLIQNGSSVVDFQFNPFRNNQIVVGCDNARINIWDLPADGLKDDMVEPSFSLTGHTEKLYFIKFHPLAEDVLLSASFDMSVRIWDLKERKEMLRLSGHTDIIFCAAWSPDGISIATVCKDRKIRLYNPRLSNNPILENDGPEGSRGARCLYVCGGKFLLVCGFGKSSVRKLFLYSVETLSLLQSTEINISPSILVPFYDEDTSCLFVTGRGEGSIYTYEVTDSLPFFHGLSKIMLEGTHQAVAYQPKFCCNVRNVEFAKAWRLTLSTIEPISITVPRVKMEFFQDDLFPETKALWKSSVSAHDWFIGCNKEPEKLDLRPQDMKPVSFSPVKAFTPRKYDSRVILNEKTDKEKSEELVNAMVEKLDIHGDPLPQDLMDGCEDDEWDD